ncbi:MAG: ABC transporter ATP-binding protein [Candidatus Magasanikbacteria bacterium]
MLTLNEVTKKFGGVTAADEVSFEVQPNKTTALIGPNGAGKTTVFNIIAGLIKPDKGTILFEDDNILDKSADERVNMGISRTFQKVRVFEYLTILDHFQMTEDHEDMKMFKNIFISSHPDREKYNQTLDQFGIDEDLDTKVKDLSYGQRKLLEMAIAVQMDHKLLMLDEPVAGVNKVIQERIEELLLEFKQDGETMLVIDHDMNFVRKLADYIVVLDSGELLVEGEPEEVLNHPKVLEAYLGE